MISPCPKVGKLGDRCLQQRHHAGRHTFPANPKKTPGQPIAPEVKR